MTKNTTVQAIRAVDEQDAQENQQSITEQVETGFDAARRRHIAAEETATAEAREAEKQARDAISRAKEARRRAFEHREAYLSYEREML